MIRISSFTEKVSPGSIVINTTSRSTNWSRGLSPFILGPVSLYDGHVSLNFENAWQFSKVYREHASLPEDGEEPTEDYFEWAKKGWADSWAHRYPMGAGRKPLYSYWAGKKLDYIEARRHLYIPLYCRTVVDTEAYRKLTDVYSDAVKEGRDIYLKDFDAYDHRRLGMTYEDVVNLPSRKMGHAFVLAMMLEGINLSSYNILESS